VTTDKSSIDDITLIRAWPGNEGHMKVPTRIAYTIENKHLRNNVWGFEAGPKTISCSWTKLLLDISATDRTYDDPKLQHAMDVGMFHLPPNIEAQHVCRDFLKELHAFMTSQIVRRMTSDFLDSTPMDCWLTVPAVWSDSAQIATKRAAKAAGFGSRPQDTINVITEPEAAAIATLKRFQEPDGPNSIKVGYRLETCMTTAYDDF